MSRKPVSSKLDLSFAFLFFVCFFLEKICISLIPPDLLPSLSLSLEGALLKGHWAQMTSSKGCAALVVNGHCSLLPPPDHGLIAEPRRELLSAPPWVRGVGLPGGRCVFPRITVLTAPPTSHFVSDRVVRGGLFRTVRVFW